jgi:hypothetical protein
MNRNQIKHLKLRATLKARDLHSHIWKSYPETGSLDTPEIAAARKLVTAWDNQIDAAQEDLKRQTDSFVTYIEELLLFVSPEEGLAALQRFEATTRESLPSCRAHIESMFPTQPR